MLDGLITRDVKHRRRLAMTPMVPAAVLRCAAVSMRRRYAPSRLAIVAHRPWRRTLPDDRAEAVASVGMDRGSFR